METIGGSVNHMKFELHIVVFKCGISAKIKSAGCYNLFPLVRNCVFAPFCNHYTFLFQTNKKNCKYFCSHCLYFEVK